MVIFQTPPMIDLRHLKYRLSLGRDFFDRTLLHIAIKKNESWYPLLRGQHYFANDAGFVKLRRRLSKIDDAFVFSSSAYQTNTHSIILLNNCLHRKNILLFD